MKSICIKNARVNNLKNVSVDIPLNKITCFVGPSGSGKSSLAFHTLYNESKRRFINSFPTSMKFFLDTPPPVDVDLIEPVLPVFSLAQINPVVGAREAVIDVLKMNEILQKIFYHFSYQKCPTHDLELKKKSLSNHLNKTCTEGEKIHLFLERDEYLAFFGEDFLPSYSYKRKIKEFDLEDKYWLLSRFKYREKDIEKKLTELKIKSFKKVFISNEKNSKLFDYKVVKSEVCPKCKFEGWETRSPYHFSPYNSLGACPTCKGFGHILDYDPAKMLIDSKLIVEGIKVLNFKPLRSGLDHFLNDAAKLKINLGDKVSEHRDALEKLLYEGGGTFEGIEKYTSYLARKKYKRSVRIFNRTIQSEYLCEECHGSRVTKEVNHSYLDKNSYFDLTTTTVEESLELLKNINTADKASRKAIDKIISLLEIASNIGLGHLNLQRKVKTLSSSEYQRLLLIKYLSFEGTNSLFIFDEPTLGLGVDEIREIFIAIRELIKLGNTVILVDHNEEVISKSDNIIALGPESGPTGGEVVYQGTPRPYIAKYLKKIKYEQLIFKKSKPIKITSIYIGKKKFENINLNTDCINLVYGKSGVGKTKIFSQLIPSIISDEFKTIEDAGLKASFERSNIKNVLIIENKFSNNSRSTFGSVSGLSLVLREYFARLPLSKSLGYTAGHFSSNSDLGRCSFCEGRGYQLIEMQYMEDIKIPCEYCNAKKLKAQIVNISDGVNNVYESFNTPVSKLFNHIKLTPKFKRMMGHVDLLNLGYLSLDREVSSLSGGERQRVNLLSKLSKNIENTLIILKNLSFGLSQKDQYKILELLSTLAQKGNTIVLIDQSTYFQAVIPPSCHIKLKTK